ncbi:hypothetical protein [Oceanimonas baumannii]|uniref:Uncharacterized protein n=1 Tax=Oceanimonas baumannii TaxID=129578 RepID=A0A235CFQ6_9GAMM|nr:hypothetical protein [Oceanimonas baumannii]OYD23392.1 hypothetical protein B6S09_13120 [Oceanimonas baumannii]TDW58455.1 hypothetical protein LY04_02231 [Oceanimonas baumannii]
MSEHIHQITKAALQFLLLILCTLIAPLAVTVDVVVLNHGMPEWGLTELLQALLILLSALLCAAGAVRVRDTRGFLILIAGFFMTMFIREFDFLLDDMQDNLWQYCVLAVFLVSVGLAACYPQSTLSGMVSAIRSVPFNYVLMGIATLLCFSRVFGTGAIWEAMLGEQGASSVFLIKSVVQEGLELFAYSIIFHSTLLFWLIEARSPEARPHQDTTSGVTS